MGFINSSENFYGGAQGNQFGALLDSVLILSGDLSAEAYTPGTDELTAEIILNSDFVAIALDSVVNDTLTAQMPLVADFSPVAQYQSNIDAEMVMTADFAPIASLSLIQPEPILEQLPDTAFQKKRQRGRLLINGIEKKFIRATYSKPRGAAGKELNIELSQAVLNLIPKNAVVKFQIGNYPYGANDWKTLIDSGKVSSRNFRLQWLADSLSFSSVEALNDKLQLCPRINKIYYDPAKAPLDVSSIEPLYDSDGGNIPTVAIGVNGLNLYNLLNVAFVQGCGFSSVQTNIPNYEVAGADFNLSSSYLDTVAPLIGIFKPEFIQLAGGGLRILNRMQKIPDDFSPVALTANKFKDFSFTEQLNQNIDGLILQFSTDAGYSAISSETKTTITELETFNIEKTETTRFWYVAPGVIARSELIHRRTEKYDASTLETVQREIIDHNFDSLGKKSSSVTTLESVTPNPDNAFSVELTSVKDTRDYYAYQADPYNSRRVVPLSITSYVKGLYTIDSENQQLGENFQQDIMKEYRSGNVSDSMNSAYGDIETHFQNFKPLRNGQIETESYTFDQLHRTMSDPVNETVSGDASLNGLTSRPHEIVIYRAGANKSNPGAPIIPFEVGPLPYVFAKPLAESALAKAINPPVSGTIEIAGYDENLERGVFFAIKDRAGESFGNFLALGFQTTIEPFSIDTNIQVEGV